MNATRLPIALALLAPALGLAQLPGLRFEATRNVVRGEVTARLNRMWRHEKMEARRLAWARQHYLAVSDDAGLHALTVRAAELGPEVSAEVVRRELKAQEAAKLASDAFFDVGEALMARSWNRFTTTQRPEDFSGVPDTKRAFYRESPELMVYLRGEAAPGFDGEPAADAWIESFAASGEPTGDSIQVKVPVTAFPAPATTRSAFTMTAPPIVGDGLFGLGGGDVEPGTSAQPVEVEVALPPVVTVDTPLPEMTPETGYGQRLADHLAAESGPSVATGWATVVVQAGDTLGDIAVNTWRQMDEDVRPPLWGPGGYVSMLHEANLGGVGGNRDQVYPGQEIWIPTENYFLNFQPNTML